MSKKILFSLFVGTLFLSGCAAPVKLQKIISAAVQPETAPTTSVSQTSLPAATSSATTTEAVPSDLLMVSWQKPEKIPSLHLFIEKSPTGGANYIGHDETFGISYYLVGQTTYNKQPAEVVAVAAPAIEMGPTDYLFFIVAKDQTVLLSQHAYTEYFSHIVAMTTLDQTELGLRPEQFVIDAVTRLQGLDFPEKLQKDNPRQTLVYKGAVWFDQAPSVQKAFDLQGEMVYTSTSTNAFYLENSTPLRPMYVVTPDFFDTDGLVPQITWTDGTKNTAEYSYVTVGGCGSSDYMQVVDPKDIDVNTDLMVAGRNNQNDPIYELKDTQNSLLKSLYRNSSTGENINYDQFLAARPLLYWIDPFGRLVELQNRKFQPQAECGKPVIYLYPTSTMDVSVNVAPAGGLTYSYPTLGDGWKVKATPYSNLTEIKTGRYYRFLYWEGRGGFYEQPKQGWVVKQASVKQFLITKLARLGLNKLETSDFLEYWLPKMQEKPYYFVTFLGNAMMDKLAPLTVTPEPDTVIRILMDFTPLDKPIAVKSFIIRTPKRKGFTVVEWGGVLR